MSDSSRTVKAIFRGIARINGTYELQAGPLRARGLPALLIGVTGIVLASGVAAALSRHADRLPETLKEARGLAEALRPHKALNA